MRVDRTLHVEKLTGPRWQLALDLLRTGDGALSLRGLTLDTVQVVAPRARRGMRVEFTCPFDPALIGRTDNDRLQPLLVREVDRARRVLAEVGAKDVRFAELVAQRDVSFECVHHYGPGTRVLVATAGMWGDPTWKWAPAHDQRPA